MTEDSGLKEFEMSKDEIDYKLRLIEVLLIIIGLILTLDTSRLFGSSPAPLTVFIFPLAFVAMGLVYFISVSQERFRSNLFEPTEIFKQDQVITQNLSQIIIVVMTAISFSASLSFDIGLVSGIGLLAHILTFTAYFIILTIFTFFGLASNRLVDLILGPTRLKVTNSLRKLKQRGEKEPYHLKRYIQDTKTYIDFIREGSLPDVVVLKELLDRSVHWWDSSSLTHNISQMVNRTKLSTEQNEKLDNFTRIISELYPKFIKEYDVLYKKSCDSTLIKSVQKDRITIYITGIFMVILGYADKPAIWPNYYETIKLDGNVDSLKSLGAEYSQTESGRNFLTHRKKMLETISNVTDSFE